MSTALTGRHHLTVWQKLCYSFGSLGHSMLDRALLLWLVVFYVPAAKDKPQLLHPAIFSAIMIFGRIVDSIADPVIARWSDSSHSRLGRRSVFMLWNGLPLAACAVLAFYPPFAAPATSGQTGANTVYLALVLGGYFFFFTAYVAPYLALFTEIATDYRDRISLGTWRAYFGMGALIGGMVVSPLLVQRYGYHAMIWIIAVPSVITMYLPFAGINEKRMCRSVPSTTPLVASLLATLRNGPFVWWLVARQTFDFGFNMIVVALPYYAMLVLDKEEGYVSTLLGGTFALTLLAMTPLAKLANRLGNKRMMMISMGGFCLLLPGLSVTGHPWNPVPPVLWAHACLALSGIPLAITLILAEPFIAQVSDLDKVATGEERQAMYFGAQGFFSKVFVGLAGGVALLVMSKFGTAVNDMGDPTPVKDGVILLGPVAGLFCIVGLWLFRRYPEKYNAESGEFYLDYDTSHMAAYVQAHPTPAPVLAQAEAAEATAPDS